MVCFAALVAAAYSVSVDDKVSSGIFLLLQITAMPLLVKTQPLVDRLLSTQSACSISIALEFNPTISLEK